MNWLNLQKGEKKVAEYKPAFIPWLISPAIFVFFAALFFGFMVWVPTKSALAGVIIFIAILILQIVGAVLSHSQAYYVITNKRLIQKSGLIGYSVKSVSYNRLADVIVRHSLMERIFGVGSVLIQTLAGQISRGSRGSEISFQYLDDPEDVQKKIYHLIDK
jgi:uncharacterized membrane protein YdbT with pleckstrin-like domain